MLILKNNPFYLKFFTSIEGYLHLFISPILIFYVTQDIKLSGLFFLVDNICKFTTYSFSGGLITPEHINSVIKYSYLSRCVFVVFSLLIFYFVPEDRFTLLMINNLGFTVSNAIFVTSIETLFQNNKLFNKNVQAKLTAGDLCSGGVAVLIILGFSYFKITFDWLLPVITVTFLSGLVVIHRLVEELNKLKKIQLQRLFRSGIQEVASTIKFISKNQEMISNMIIGYVPFAFFLVVEQINIFRFSHLYNDLTMKLLHFSFKSVWFLSGALIVPILVNKSREINQIFKLGTYAFLIGGVCSLIPEITWLNLLGTLLLGYAHNLIFVYRKINRRRILDNAKVGFQSLGVFFAIEGLSGIIANTYLAIFGMSYVVLCLMFVGSGVYLFKRNQQVQRDHTKILNENVLPDVGEAERRAEG